MNTTRIGPILFSTPMVQAIRREENPKTQTRRVILPQPPMGWFLQDEPMISDAIGYQWTEHDWDDDMMGWFPSYENGLKPKYQVGNILWVRETWCNMCEDCDECRPKRNEYLYKADESHLRSCPYEITWRPSIFMPREACRLFLRVTDVRVERVQGISEADALAEGIGVVVPIPESIGRPMPKLQFRIVWDEINAKRGFGWEKNPWVWAYTFERIAKPEGWPKASSPQHGGTYREGGA